MQCKHIKHDNTPCKAKALTGDDYCFMHSPRAEKQRKQANSKGGKHSYKETMVSSGYLSIKKPKDILKLLNSTINEVRTGQLDVKIANCIGYLSSHFLKAHEYTELEQRLEAVEDMVLNKK